MPDIPMAIKVNTTVVSPTETRAGWGAGALVGVSNATVKNTAKRYHSAEALVLEHGADSLIGKAAVSAFAQGIRSLYAVSVAAASEIPTAAELEAAFTSLAEVVRAGTVRIAVLAGVASDKPELTAALKTWADANDVIYVVTNPKGASVSQITSAAAALDSDHGFFAAHATSLSAELSDDVAAAAMAVLTAAKPGYTLQWEKINVKGIGYFTYAERVALENSRVNYLTDLQNDGTNRLSNGLTLTADESEPAQYIDITISRMYVAERLQSRIAQYCLATRKVPYTPTGLEYIRTELVSALAEISGDDNVLSAYSVVMPQFADIPTEDIRNRRLTGVSVWCRLSGNIQEFVINLTLEAL